MRHKDVETFTPHFNFSDTNRRMNKGDGKNTEPEENKDAKKELFPGSKFSKLSRKPTRLIQNNKYVEMGNVISLAIAVAVLTLLPYIHLDVVYRLWNEFTRKVNKTSCTCNCWDSTFKMKYETGIPQYKHIYFNITGNTLKIWIITVIAVLLFYESTRRACHLFLKKELRISMLLLFISSIYSHYYSWWSFLNFWNDDYYWQWYHQLLFSLTELISTYFVVHLFDNEQLIEPWRLVAIVSIAVSHSLTALTDQFGYNVLRGEGETHQVLRDIAFMIPDLFHIYVAIQTLRKHAKQLCIPAYLLISNKLFAVSILYVIFIWIFSVFL